MSSTKNSDDWIGIMLVGTLVYIITLFSAYSIAVTYIQHKCQEPAEVSRGWSPPKIVKYENCALWDEIRKECEDD